MSLFKFLFSKTFLKQLAIALGVFLILFFIFSNWLDATTNHDEFKEVPDLMGKDVELAKKLLSERDLQLGAIEYKDYNPKYPKGGIVEHNPKAGAKVKEGRKIYISVNKTEYRLVEIPDLVSQTNRQAITTLKAIGFKIGEVTYKPYFAKNVLLEIKADGKVVKPGDKLPYTTTVDLVLGDGKINYGEKPKEETTTEEGNSNEGGTDQQ